MDISENIKNLRVSHGYTQHDLADILQVKPTAVSAWESGRNKPLMDKVTIMAKLFSVTTSQIVGDTFESSDILPIYKKLSSERKHRVYNFAQHELDNQLNEADIPALKAAHKPDNLSEDEDTQLHGYIDHLGDDD